MKDLKLLKGIVYLQKGAGSITPWTKAKSNLMCRASKSMIRFYDKLSRQERKELEELNREFGELSKEEQAQYDSTFSAYLFAKWDN
jgi:hypothetical protein